MVLYKVFTKVALSINFKPLFLKGNSNKNDLKVLEDVLYNLFTKVNYPHNVDKRAVFNYISTSWRTGVILFMEVMLDLKSEPKQALKCIRDFNIHPDFIKRINLVSFTNKGQ